MKLRFSIDDENAQRVLSLLAGAALALAYFVAAASLHWAWLGLLLFVPIFLGVALLRFRRGDQLQSSSLIWLTLALLCIHALALVFSETLYVRKVMNEICAALLILGIFVVGDSRVQARNMMLDGFFTAAMWLGFPVLLFALLKCALLERGFMIDFLYRYLGGDYPPGASLRGDYNLFGLALMPVAIGFARSAIARGKESMGWIWPASALGLAIAVFALGGSRRAILIGTTVPLVYLAIGLYLSTRTKHWLASLGPLIVTTVVALSAFWWVDEPRDSERLVVTSISAALRTLLKVNEGVPHLPAAESSPKPESPSTSPSATLSAPGAPAVAPVPVAKSSHAAEPLSQSTAATATIPGPLVVPNTVMPNNPRALLGTMNAHEMYGTASRMARWQEALKLLSKGGWVVPVGFTYHEIFACKFLSCGEIDYPHMAFLSEWLIGGIVGLLLTILWFGNILFSMFKKHVGGITSGATPLVLCSLPFPLISGDTLFTIPQLLIAALLLNSVRRTER